MNKCTGYRCSLCGTEYLPGQVTYTCPKDGGNLDVIPDYEFIKKKFQPEDITSRESSLWRYLPLLPVDEPEGDSTPLHAAGWTPVFALPRLAEKLNLKHLWLKDESRNPTASFKDRAQSLSLLTECGSGMEGRDPTEEADHPAGVRGSRSSKGT